MRKWPIAILGVVAISLWSAMAYGLPPGRMGGVGPGRMGEGSGMLIPLVLRGVDLTPEQEARIRDIMSAHRAAFKALFEQMRQAHEDLSSKLFAPGEVQTAELTPYIQRLAQLREQLMQEGLAVAMEVRGVLTPEQLAKAAQLKERLQALHSEMRGLLQGQE